MLSYEYYYHSLINIILRKKSPIYKCYSCRKKKLQKIPQKQYANKFKIERYCKQTSPCLPSNKTKQIVKNYGLHAMMKPTTRCTCTLCNIYRTYVFVENRANLFLLAGVSLLGFDFYSFFRYFLVASVRLNKTADR